MRILIYGAGVIGSLYAALLSEVGYDVSVYARGGRLEELRKNGLLYKVGKDVKSASVSVLSHLKDEDVYDYILLTVRETQLYTALEELQSNRSPTIVTMVNSLETYDRWENICGKGRILPAFPGAGGGFNGAVLEADLTPRMIQPTTIGRVDGREERLARIFRAAGIPCQIVPDMYVWQICHLAMVVPLADAYYESSDPAHAGRDKRLMRKTAEQMGRNLRAVKSCGIRLSPPKMNLFLYLPAGAVGTVLGMVYRSRFGDRFMYRHSMKAPDEMKRLHTQLYEYIG